ncbi:site-specific integrase [candidate division KSB1 bacterium]|nr:site-specific integrase [candidate division KSB1 bacterium]
MGVKLRKRKVSDGKVSLYLDIYYDGKRDYDFLKLYLTGDREANKEVLKLAESIRAKKQLEIQNSAHGFIPQFKNKANFIEYFEKLVSEKDKKGRAWYSTSVHLKNFAGDTITFSKITEQWLNEFKNYLLSKIGNNTAHTYFLIVKAALKQAVKDKIILSSPGNQIAHIKKYEVKRSFLTQIEIQKLADAPCDDPEVKRAFLFSCYTGLRMSDVRKLTRQNIDGDRIEFRQEKTKSVEYLHLSPTAKTLLNRNNILNMPNAPIFKLPSRQWIAIVMKKWCDNAGISKHVTFHTARHTFATLALTESGDLYTVSKLLGHKNINTTQIYAKVVDEKKRAVMDALPKINLKN